MYCSFITPSSVSGHSGSFHILAVVNSAAMKTGVHVPFRVIGLLDICPGVGLLHHMVILLATGN